MTVGVRVLMGIDPKAELQDLCVESRMSEDLLYILKHIESLNYPMFEYRVCGSKRLHGS